VPCGVKEVDLGFRGMLAARGGPEAF
jgi:hypothetical protein